MSRRFVFTLTIVLWLGISLIWAYFYVRARLALPQLEGYEKDWDFQVLMFFLSRFPIALILLVLSLFAENTWMRKSWDQSLRADKKHAPRSWN